MGPQQFKPPAAAGRQARPWNVENEPLPWGESLSPLMEVAGSEWEKCFLTADRQPEVLNS